MSKESFVEWMNTQYSQSTKKIYAEGTISSYCSAAMSIEKRNLLNKSIFDITDINEFNEAKETIMNNPNYETVNDIFSKGLKSFLDLYPFFLKNEDTEFTKKVKNGEVIITETDSTEETMSNYYEEYSPNLIYFGAPGTGKSHTLNKNIENLLSTISPEERANYYERVTFHPDYSYANFVGTYKPTPLEDNTITYKYVPGPFMRVYKKAIQDTSHDYLLIIEEINRADVAAVFGDIFQLLDRKDDNSSEYPIQASEDIKHYLKSETNLSEQELSTLSIPSNMYIWATMNSADQGVFPMDTAFKRRWNFIYMDIDNGQREISYINFTAGKKNTIINWNALRKAINDELLSYGINEDKLMGPFFINISKDKFSEKSFKAAFNNKVLMYLFDDAAKQKRNELFSGIDDVKDRKQFSKIVSKFNELGVKIFNSNISSKFEKDDKSEE